MGPRDWLILAAFTLGTLAIGLASGLTAAQTADQYRDLEQPSWAPPSWLFGPVWTVLYLMVGLAGYLAWQKVGWSRPLALWGIQLALNLAWTPLFFGAGLRGLALVDLAALLVALVATILLFWRVSRPAAYLLLPYGVWVCFATALNASIWLLNR